MKPKYIQEAEKLVGIHETAGKLATKEIKEIFADAGHPEIVSDEVPWCAAFLGATLARANKPNSGSLRARSYSEPSWLANCVNHGTRPKINSVGVMKRGNSNWEGHVGYVVKFDDNYVWLLGGNQSDSVNVTKFPRSKFISFATPKEDSQDVPTAEIVKSSRSMTFTNWMTRAYYAVATAITAAWNYSDKVWDIAQKNMGWVLLGLLGIGIAANTFSKSQRVREYKQGRYLPSKQWED